MAELHPISESQSKTEQHIIFIHGLGGHHYKTWQALDDSKVFWPKWLAEDVKDISVWTIGYNAAISYWRGTAMHLPDRAMNILERILAEQKLKAGEIIFIGHSLGGLVIKQLMRRADSIASLREDAAIFLQRVHKVVFLATPHAGAGKATLADNLRRIFRPSAATVCLVRNDPNLRDLNIWYRGWSNKKNIEHLILTETRPIPLLGLVVEPDSSDPGLLSPPIPIDADHYTISKPRDRSSEIYIHIKNFITHPFDSVHNKTTIENALNEQTIQLTKLIGSTHENCSRLIQLQEQGRETSEILKHFHNGFYLISSTFPQYPKELIDSVIQKQLSTIKQSRFFKEFSTIEHSLRLGKKVFDGELSGGSDKKRSEALAWCSRF